MFKVGVTGGIGSGKTFVCQVFSTLGVPVYHADRRARYLMEHDRQLIEALKNEFGEGIYADQDLVSQTLAKMVFSDAEALQRVNNIVHPAVKNDFLQWIIAQHGHEYAIQEAAILFESGADNWMDYVIAVYAPVELRIQRVLSRSSLNRNEVLERIGNQMDQEEINQRADAVIRNDDERLVLPQIMDLHEKILSKELFL
jgi:dephospho-CoA kinase